MSVAVSAVIPVKDEAGNVAPLAREIAAGLAGEAHEIIFVDDGSTDGTAQALAALKAELPQLRVLRHDRNLGVKRKDTASRRIASRLGNRFRNFMLGDGASDTGCGLKAFRRDAFLALPYFDHMHRFLIALVQREGWKVAYAPVNHRPRLTGASKYTNFGRMLVSVHDLLGVRWLQRRYRGRARIEEL